MNDVLYREPSGAYTHRITGRTVADPTALAMISDPLAR